MYPSVMLLPAFGARATLDSWDHDAMPEAAGTLLPFLVPPLMLFVVGLARLSTPRGWDAAVERNGRARLRDAWTAGKGLLWPTYGLWICVLLLDLIVLGGSYLVLSSVADQGATTVAYLIGGPLLLFSCAYAAVISVLFQLALHSLAQNRRGVVSALQHGWRLAQNDPWATVRSALVDCALSLALWALIAFGARIIFCFLPFLWVAHACLTAITGVARALYWGRVYRALGGLTPEDGVPGLPPAGL